MTIILPNIRKLFIPDSGHFIASVDLSGADAQVVAWEAEDEDLKAAFRAGIPIHQKNAEDMFGPAPEPKTRHVPAHARNGSGGMGDTGHGANGPPRDGATPVPATISTVFWPGRGDVPKHPRYQNCKQAIHAADYAGAPTTIAQVLGWKIATTQEFMGKWFDLHPNIRNIWWKKVEDELSTSRSASNRLGYRIIYFDRIKNCFTDALAWGPQSTVGIVCSRGGVQVRKALPWIDILLQVHDELVLQFPWRYEDKLTQLRECLQVEIPYDDPLIIPWKLAMSRESWGDCKGRSWE